MSVKTKRGKSASNINKGWRVIQNKKFFKIQNFNFICTYLLQLDLDVGNVMDSMLGPNRVIAKAVKSCTYCCYVTQ